MLLPFTKMHGLGNDFVIFDTISDSFNIEINADFCKRIAHRNLGIGCDQIMLLSKASHENSDFYCRIFNADGSEAGMSGNGLRCLAKLIVEKQLTTQTNFYIKTCNRNVEITVTVDGVFTQNNQSKHNVAEYEDAQEVVPNIVDITLNLGCVDFDPQKIPLDVLSEAKHYSVATEYGIFAFGAVSVGNPHAVILVDDVEKIDVAKIGKAISLHKIFPEQINVNFMQIIDRENIKLRTYERGTGETFACGSGSSASVVIGRLWDLLDPKVTVHLHYGNLQITWYNIQSSLMLTGDKQATQEVFCGVIDENLLFV